MSVNAAQLEHAIKGIKFPASKGDLVKQAKNNKANDDVVKVIKDLPGRKFSSPIEVSKAFGKEHK